MSLAEHIVVDIHNNHQHKSNLTWEMLLLKASLIFFVDWKYFACEAPFKTEKKKLVFWLSVDMKMVFAVIKNGTI